MTFIVVVAAAAVEYFAARSSGQPQVGADILPLVASAHRGATCVDCSRINAITYDPHNPCQTFVLIESHQSRSATVLLDSEARQLSVSGWRHSAPQPVDYDQGEAMVSTSGGWVAAGRQVCAYIATDKVGSAAEAYGLFPYDPYNQPGGVLEFYRKPIAEAGTTALWVRLEPNVRGQCLG